MEYLKELGQLCRRFGHWMARNPLPALLLAAVVTTIIYFFGFLRLFAGQAQPIWAWAWLRFVAQYNQEHSKIIPPIVLWLVWYHREKIAAAPKQGSNLGLPFILFGLLCYVVGARALQARVSLFGFPFLLFGIVLYLWGKQIARILLFPCAMLFFMIPLGAIEQMTFRLQFLSTGIVMFLSRLFGMSVVATGTSIRPVSGQWEGFDIAEGCSGIHSLIAMVMITAVYVHLCESKLWKKATILAFSVLFAVIGNAGRLFTIIVIAQMGHPKFAGGLYHEYSGFIFFPIAALAMIGFSKLLNLDHKKAPGGKGLREKVVYDC